jgi:hypothetical protein
MNLSKFSRIVFNIILQSIYIDTVWYALQAAMKTCEGFTSFKILLDIGLYFVRMKKKKKKIAPYCENQATNIRTGENKRLYISKECTNTIWQTYFKNSFPTSEWTNLSITDDHPFCVRKGKHCLLYRIIMNKHTVVDTTQHLWCHAGWAHTFGYLCALFKFQQLFCSNFFI